MVKMFFMQFGSTVRVSVAVQKYVIGIVGFVNIVIMCSFASSCYREKKNVVDDTVVISGTHIAEIANIALSKRVTSAFQTIETMNSETRENHIFLNEIPAPPFKEHQRASHFLRMAKEAGADSVWMDSIGNVLALRKGLGQKGTVVVDGHLDTVFPEGTDVTVKQKGDTLYAPGISDNARSLAMMLTLLKVLDLHDIRTASDLLFLASVGEEGEGDLRGVKYFFKNVPLITSFISIDIGDMGTITNQAVGSLRYKVKFEGPGGHSLGDFGTVSPHFAMAHALSRWDDQAAEYVKSVAEKTSYNIGVVGGGTSVNSIPFESWATIDIRSEKSAHLNQLQEMLQSAISGSADIMNAKKRKSANLTARKEKIGDRPPGLTAPTIPVLQRAMASIGFFGKTYELRSASTNANLPMSLGIPAITVGQGGKSGGIHSLDEWWLDEEGDLAIQGIFLLILAEAGS